MAIFSSRVIIKEDQKILDYMKRTVCKVYIPYEPIIIKKNWVEKYLMPTKLITIGRALRQKLNAKSRVDQKAGSGVTAKLLFLNLEDGFFDISPVYQGHPVVISC